MRARRVNRLGVARLVLGRELSVNVTGPLDGSTIRCQRTPYALGSYPNCGAIVNIRVVMPAKGQQPGAVG